MNPLVRTFERLATRGWQLTGLALGTFVLWTVFTRLSFVWVTLFVALLMTALLTQPADWLESLGVPRTPAALIVMLGGLLILGGIITGLVLRFIDQIPELIDQVDQITQHVRTWLQGPPLNMEQGEFSDLLDQVVERVQANLDTFAGQALRRTITALQVIGGLLFALVLTFFLLRDRRQILDWALDRTIGDGHHREAAESAVLRSWATLQGYIRGTVIIGLLDAGLIGIGLLVLGVPLAVPLMALTFFGAFFPVIGATVAGVLAAAIAAISEGFVDGLLVAGIVIIVQQIDGNVFQPMIMGYEVNLHPVVILLVLTAGGLVAGIVGAAMAVPVTAVLANVTAELRTAET